MNKDKNNILLIWLRMGDYHRARWAKLKSLMSDKGSVYAADFGSGDDLYKWDNTSNNPDYFCLSEKGVDQKDLKNRFKSFRKILKEKQINTVCIPGYGRLDFIVYMIYAKFTGRKVILFAESWYSNSKLDLLKGTFVKLFCDMVFVSGLKSKSYFSEKQGVSSDKIVTGYSVVDNAHFSSSDVPKNRYELLCVARFSPEKNLEALIKAFKQSKLSKRWSLRLVGDGPQKDEVKAMTKHDDNIIIESWKTYDELPELYNAASAFILPSTFEPWGLVVNEAMAAGLPIIVSDNCGCEPDLLKEGKNGFLIESNNIVRALDRLSECDENTIAEMGSKSREIIKNFSLTTWSQKIISE